VHRVREIRAEAPNAVIVLLASGPHVDGLEEILDAGVVLCLSGSAALQQIAALLRATPEADPAEPDPVEEVEAPACPLTAREMEILRSVAEGHTNARIGRELWVTEQTVKFHLSNIYRKLGVSNRTEASRYALVNHLFDRRPRPAARPSVPATAADVRIAAALNGTGASAGPAALHAVAGER
jgi:DNA-binding NarL/FixJ family response regulator